RAGTKVGTPTWLQARSVGVRFHLGLAASVLHCPANELADARPDLAAVWAGPPPTLSSTSRPRRRRRRHERCLRRRPPPALRRRQTPA
ncbi:MAG: hypothetical protein M3292_12390, partial [Actinomycetota bacterium]|nr:hypothetical protein [Actinomycetota bacterium]